MSAFWIWRMRAKAEKHSSWLADFLLKITLYHSQARADAVSS
jgi:hypothetical protein